MGASMDADAAAGGMRESMKFSYQQPGKKASTILSSHLDTVTFGSMFIDLDNATSSLPLGKPITGKIKVSLKEPFEAKALTLGIRGI